jgi:hypothetical protein
LASGCHDCSRAFCSHAAGEYVVPGGNIDQHVQLGGAADSQGSDLTGNWRYFMHPVCFIFHLKTISWLTPIS